MHNCQRNMNPTVTLRSQGPFFTPKSHSSNQSPTKDPMSKQKATLATFNEPPFTNTSSRDKTNQKRPSPIPLPNYNQTGRGQTRNFGVGLIKPSEIYTSLIGPLPGYHTGRAAISRSRQGPGYKALWDIESGRVSGSSRRERESERENTGVTWFRPVNLRALAHAIRGVEIGAGWLGGWSWVLSRLF